jgi:outer membrane PBP1 activator LpoA protein
MLAATAAFAQPGDGEQAARLAARGDHAAAAAAWERAAGDARGAATVAPLVAAAHEWLAAGRDSEAFRVARLAEHIPRIDPRSRDGTARGLVVAEIALASGDPQRSLAALRALGEPPPPGTESAVLGLRGRAYCAAGRPADGVRAFLARERGLPPGVLPGARRELWAALAAAARAGVELGTPRDADSVLAGWLDLARSVGRTAPGSPLSREQVAGWRNRYPQHPASALLAEPMTERATPPAAPPAATPAAAAPTPSPAAAPEPRTAAQVALLVPLTGRLAEAGEALRDGFMAAYYRQDESTRPALRVYDAASDPVAAYRRALDDGAGFVVGPLGKENVQAVRAVADGRVGVLALNVLPEGEAVPTRFYQYALAPEDEARQVAERLLADGRRTGVALVPSGEWGSRVVGAFQAAFSAGGGRLVTTQTYAATTTDFSDVLVPVLGFEDSQRRFKAISALVGAGLQFTPRRRDDLEFVFFGGQPVHGRLVRQQLKFFYAGDLPVYSVSDVFEPNAAANQDLEGVAFVDMPWMISDAAPIVELRGTAGALWPGSARRRGRLFAMGHDAWLLVTALRRGAQPFGTPIPGLSGTLTVDAAGRVHRVLEWSAIGADGQPHALGAGAGEP